MIFVIKNKYWPLILLLIFTLISTPSINAQKTKTVTGEGVGYNSDMLKAREAALFEAKKNAWNPDIYLLKIAFNDGSYVVRKLIVTH